MPLRILLVDDDEDIHSLVLALLPSHKIVTATSVAGATALLVDNDYDLLVLDVNLPDGSGDDLLSSLRALRLFRRNRKADVIMLTASSDKRVLERSRLLSSIAYIRKPLEPSLFCAAVEAVAEARR